MPRNLGTMAPFSSIVDCRTTPSGEISAPRSLSKPGMDMGNMKPREISSCTKRCKTVGWSEADLWFPRLIAAVKLERRMSSEIKDRL